MIYDDTYILERLAELGNTIEIYKEGTSPHQWAVAFSLKHKRFVEHATTQAEAICKAHETYCKLQQYEEQTKYRSDTQENKCARCNGFGMVVKEQELMNELIRPYIGQALTPEHVFIHMTRQIIEKIELTPCPRCRGCGYRNLLDYEVHDDMHGYGTYGRR